MNYLKIILLFFIASVLYMGCKKTCLFCKECQSEKECERMIVGQWEGEGMNFIFRENKKASYWYEDIDDNQIRNDSLTYDIKDRKLDINYSNGFDFKEYHIDKLNKKKLKLGNKGKVKLHRVD